LQQQNMTSETSHPNAPQDARRPTLLHLALVLARVGAIGFGGGMAVVALMEQELVRRRRWLELDEFLHGVGLGQMLGSFAVNAAAFAGYRLAGVAGALVAVVSFLAPSITLVIVLSALYFRFHAVPALQSAVTGLGPVVVALIASAAWSIGSRSLGSWPARVLAACALAAGILRVNPAWILLASGLAGLFLRLHGGAAPARAGAEPEQARLPLLAAPAALTAAAGLADLAAVFFRIGLIFFGGGFVLLPVLHHRLVGQLGWLSPREFIDGVAISQLTPGPIAVLATFAGYHRQGVSGALVATAALFLPGLLWMLFLSRQYELRRDQPLAQRFLAGVNPAVTGLVASAAFVLGKGSMASWPHWTAAALAFFLLVKVRLHPAPVLAVAALAGWLGWIQ
jgi:chromate transporter